MSDSLGRMTLGEFLERARDLPRWALGCVPALSPLALEDECLVVDSRDLDEDEDVPAKASASGLTRTIGRRVVLDVRDNLELQRPNATLGETLDALNYYVQAGAFIDLRPDDGDEDLGSRGR